MSVTNKPVPIHQWTHDGAEVLIVKYVGKDGETYKGFRWPLTVGASVESPNWAPTPDCESGGLFGWPWGMCIGDGKDPDWSATWLVFGAVAADVIQLDGGKVKAHRGVVRFVGAWWEATAFVLSGQMAWVHHNARGSASSTGERGSASSTGGSGSASSTGECSAAVVTGLSGRALGGTYGAIALAWLNKTANRSEMRCARIGCGDGSDDTLKANVWYVLNEVGEFIELETHR
jgi:hypothetical protein